MQLYLVRVRQGHHLRNILNITLKFTFICLWLALLPTSVARAAGGGVGEYVKETKEKRDIIFYIQSLTNSKETKLRVEASREIERFFSVPLPSSPSESSEEASRKLLLRQQVLAKEIVPTLIEVIRKDPEPEVRFYAISSLNPLAYEARAAVPALIDRLKKDTDAQVKSSAAWSLTIIGLHRDNKTNTILSNKVEVDTIVSALIEAIKSNKKDAKVRASAINALRSQNLETIVPVLLDSLANDSDAEVRASAASILGEYKTNTTILALINALKNDTDSQVRNSAIYSLDGVSNQQEVAPTLIELISGDKDSSVRTNAVRILGNIKLKSPEIAISTLIKVIESDSPADVRSGAISTLAKIALDDKSVVSTLIKTLNEDTQLQVRSSAIGSLGDVKTETKDVISTLTKVLEKEQDTQMRSSTIYSVQKIAERFKESPDDYSQEEFDALIMSLDKSLKILQQQGFNTFSEEQQNTFIRTIKTLKKQRDSRISKQVVELIQKYPWISIFAVLPVASVAYLIVLRFRPRWLLHLPAEFKIPGTNIELIKLPPEIQSWLKYRPIVLDDWVKTNIKVIRSEFEEKQTVKDRSAYIPIGVTVGGKTFPQLNSEILKPHFADERFRIIIWGDGGAGKTSLACQIAKWAMSEDTSKRPFQHYMIPILIEELDDKVADGKQPFREAIKAELNELTNSNATISDELCDQLLRKQRLLVIVDRFSEMSETSRQQIRPNQLAEFPANALIITSRQSQELNMSKKLEIQPSLIEGVGLSIFLDNYLTQLKKRNIFSDQEYLDACSRLNRVVGKGRITALLATLYADLMIANKEGKTQEYLSDNIPDLILSFLNYLNRNNKEEEFDDRIIQLDAKVIAWECMKLTYRPAPTKRDDILAVMDGINKEKRLKYLENHLRIIEYIQPAKTYLRFKLDPLAEYLAGLHLVDIYSSDENKWKNFLETAANSLRTREAVQGFLISVLDCCMLKKTEAKIPNFVLERLEELTDLNPTTEVGKSEQVLVSSPE
jgi:HEAT repeat protein